MRCLNVCFALLLMLAVPVKAEERADDVLSTNTHTPTIRIIENKNEELADELEEVNEEEVEVESLTSLSTAAEIPSVDVEVGTDFDLSNYVEIETEALDASLLCYGTYDVSQSGTYKVKLVVLDSDGHTASQDLIINVVDKEEEEAVIVTREVNTLVTDYVAEAQANTSENVYEALANNGTVVGGDAYSIAQSLLGRGGWCTDIANAFLAAFYGDGSNCFNVYAVSASEAQPGDVVYYSNGGLGVQHYAIYLGGDTALHGNWLGTTVIRSVYINNASSPQFYRPAGH